MKRKDTETLRIMSVYLLSLLCGSMGTLSLIMANIMINLFYVVLAIFLFYFPCIAIVISLKRCEP